MKKILYWDSNPLFIISELLCSTYRYNRERSTRWCLNVRRYQNFSFEKTSRSCKKFCKRYVLQCLENETGNKMALRHFLWRIRMDWSYSQNFWHRDPELRMEPDFERVKARRTAIIGAFRPLNSRSEFENVNHLHINTLYYPLQTAVYENIVEKKANKLDFEKWGNPITITLSVFFSNKQYIMHLKKLKTLSPKKSQAISGRSRFWRNTTRSTTYQMRVSTPKTMKSICFLKGETFHRNIDGNLKIENLLERHV